MGVRSFARAVLVGLLVVVAAVVFGSPASASGLSVVPSHGLTDGQAVTVSGTGPNPNALVIIEECSSALLSLSQPVPLSTIHLYCSSGANNIGIATTGSQSNVPPTVIEVNAQFTTISSNAVSCTNPGDCAVVVLTFGPSSFSVFVGQPISFGVPDTDLALTGVPADITVNATSPTGTVVTYAPPTAVDEENPPPVICTPSPGSSFPIGVTTVTCFAFDRDDTPSLVSTNFQVTVLSAAQQLGNLANAVVGVGSGNSLAANVAAIQNAPNANAQCNDIKLFENEVNAQAGKKLTSTQASALLTAAQNLYGTFGC